MKDTLGIIYAAEDDTQIREITKKRSIAALPFGGRYRLIDFTLSNMVNSGIKNIGIITQNNYASLVDHLGTGKEWDLNRKREGLSILSPFAVNDSIGWYKGSIDALHSAMGFIKKGNEKYVLISGTHMLCNMNFNECQNFHIEKGADITVIYKEEDIRKDKLKKYTLLQTDEDGKVTDIEAYPSIPKSNKISMKMYLLEKELLEYLIEEASARGYEDFVKDIIIKKIGKLKVYGYPYKGYLARIDSINTYYRYSMELLKKEVRDELFYREGLIYTRIKDEVPAKYSDNALVKNCLVADGCIIEGEIENCILFRGVRISKGAKIKNSIIFQECEIEENAVLDHVILDKKVVVKRGRTLIGTENYPVAITKGEVI
ncbi:MAG: glucose-1-phosphate adenylyltransferase subunit GlgD [Caloramator sp.]|nr:glucose-1-phosphate adenylyltransferase subunit GlgD [Caloramator sp.]